MGVERRGMNQSVFSFVLVLCFFAVCNSSLKRCCVPRIPRTGSLTWKIVTSHFCEEESYRAKHEVRNIAVENSNANNCDPDDLILMTFRNPLKHLSSLWASYKTTRKAGKPEGSLWPKMDNFTKIPEFIAAYRIRNFNPQTRYLLGLSITDFTTYIATKPEDELHEAIYNALEELDFVGLTDQYDETFLLLADTFNEPPLEKYIQRLHRADHTPDNQKETLHVEWTKDEEDYIREVNNLDFFLFATAHSLFNKRMKEFYKRNPEYKGSQYVCKSYSDCAELSNSCRFHCSLHLADDSAVQEA